MKAYRYERERRRLRRMIKRRHADAVTLAGSHELVTLPSGLTRLRSRRTGEMFAEVNGLEAWLPVFYPQSAIDEILWKANPLTAHIAKPSPFFGLDRSVAKLRFRGLGERQSESEGK